MFTTLDNNSCNLFQSSKLSRNSFKNFTSDKVVKHEAKNVRHVAHSIVAISGIEFSGEAYPSIC
jgi:ATP sulfurylase